jgi:hypothetical protein
MKKRSADIVVRGAVTVFVIIAMIVFYWAWTNGPIFFPLY